MHEWALAEGIISTALHVAEGEKWGQITRIHIKMGELQQVDIELFELALKQIREPQSPMVMKAKIELEEEKAILKCRGCGREWAFSDALQQLDEEERESIHFVPEIAHVYITCPRCESPDFEFVKGRGVWLDSIEGE